MIVKKTLGKLSWAQLQWEQHNRAGISDNNEKVRKKRKGEGGLQSSLQLHRNSGYVKPP